MVLCRRGSRHSRHLLPAIAATTTIYHHRHHDHHWCNTHVPPGMRSTVYLTCATSAPSRSYRTGYACTTPCFRHSEMPCARLMHSRQTKT